MRIGFRISAAQYETMLPLAAKLGFEDLEPEWSLEASQHFPAMAELAKGLGIRLSAVLTGMDPMRPDDFRQAFEDCQKIGALSFTGHPHPLGLDDEAAQREFQDRFGAAAEMGAKMGVRLAVHSCGLGPEQWDLMFRLVPALGLKYDPSFTMQAGRNYASEIFKYGPRIVHAHAKDEIPLGRTTDYSTGLLPMTYGPPGMGAVNWGTVIACLYEVGYDEQIAIEPHSAYWCGAGLERGLLLARRHLEQFIA
jgi:sugar phosphate isomerase/epimerase